MRRKGKNTHCHFMTTMGAAAMVCFAAVAGAADPHLLNTATGQPSSLLSAILKMAGSLAVVVSLMLILIYFLKKTGLNQGAAKPGSMIRIMDTRMVAPKKYIAIVEIADKCLAVGITDHTISMLTELSDEVKNDLSASCGKTTGRSSFASALRKSLQSFKTPLSGQQQRGRE